ncbi:DUF6596 domain-containing protein [Salinispora mooreana]|uniref:DUF6596 domain-containing protein n=1 Tax=Salinispora mooreana TaxID=999545 RepID=UPI0003A1F901|nr:DUF6596 domain-containing protein [Salinispora mooreana]
MLSVLYVIFTEGSAATSGDRLLRPDIAYEAIRLARTAWIGRVAALRLPHGRLTSHHTGAGPRRGYLFRTCE